MSLKATIDKKIQITSASLSKKTGGERGTMGVAKRYALSHEHNNINAHSTV